MTNTKRAGTTKRICFVFTSIRSMMIRQNLSNRKLLCLILFYELTINDRIHTHNNNKNNNDKRTTMRKKKTKSPNVFQELLNGLLVVLVEVILSELERRAANRLARSDDAVDVMIGDNDDPILSPVATTREVELASRQRWIRTRPTRFVTGTNGLVIFDWGISQVDNDDCTGENGDSDNNGGIDDSSGTGTWTRFDGAILRRFFRLDVFVTRRLRLKESTRRRLRAGFLVCETTGNELFMSDGIFFRVSIGDEQVSCCGESDNVDFDRELIRVAQ